MKNEQQQILDFIKNNLGPEGFCESPVSDIALYIKKSHYETVYLLRNLQRLGFIEVLSDGFGMIGIYIVENNSKNVFLN